MATYEGVVAGIGDKATNTNVIQPNFDAATRNFIIGKDCILDGLELSRDGLKLTAGYCVGQGFVGELKSDITFSSAPTKIYGHFTINHSDEIDKFDIETYSSGTPEDNNVNILTTAGEYWLLLYNGLVEQVDRNYPENAAMSDMCMRLLDNGTIGENVEVEGEMKPSYTNDKTVATTEWVHKAVADQIGYKTVEIKYGSYTRDGTFSRDIGIIKLEKKADYVIATARRTSTLTYDVDLAAEYYVDLVDEVPDEFYGVNIMYIPVEYILLNNTGRETTYETVKTIIKVGGGADNVSGWKTNL